jgi:hypothetical protein
MWTVFFHIISDSLFTNHSALYIWLELLKVLLNITKIEQCCHCIEHDAKLVNHIQCKVGY